MATWTSIDDYRAIAPTDDPRMVAVIELQQDTSSNGPDGDAYAPAYWLEYGRGAYGANRAGSVFDDEQAANAYAAALTQYSGDTARAERYMRVMHGVGVIELDMRGNGGGGRLVVLDTPAWREAVGIPDTHTTAEAITGDAAVWLAVMDGDVWGVGYAVNVNRLDADEPVDLDELGWAVDIVSYGYYGREWATEAALEQLPTAEDTGLSPVTPLTREAVATMHELDAAVSRLQRSGWWHEGTDHGAARALADRGELAAIRDDDGAALSRMYGGGVFAVFDDADRAELIDRVRAYWGLSAYVRTAAGA